MTLIAINVVAPGYFKFQLVILMTEHTKCTSINLTSIIIMVSFRLDLSIKSLFFVLSFEHIMRREGLQLLITSNKMQSMRGRRRQGEKMLDSLATWLNVMKVTSLKSATKNLRTWKNMITDGLGHLSVSISGKYYQLN